MHRYHLADVFTLARFGCAVILIMMALAGTASGWPLVVFGLGEICDGLDGAAAKFWPYPRDGKYRWWRDAFGGKFPEYYDQAVDVMLGLAGLLYIGLNINPGFAMWVTGIGASIGICVQIWRSYRIHLIPNEKADPLRQWVIRIRRILYILAMAVIIWMLIWRVPGWAEVAQWLMTGIALFVGGIALYAKRDRLKYDKPPKS